jgi:hypothetical protein
MSFLRFFAPALRVIPYAIPIVVGVLVIRKLSEGGSSATETAPTTGPTPSSGPKSTPPSDTHPMPTFDPSWRTWDVVALARRVRESRDFSVMPILADALQEAGCNDAAILDHCRNVGPSASKSWVVDRILASS